jgi:hypothetical protein
MQVLLLLNYLISFSMIFRQISQNLSVLREQLTVVEEEDVQAMYDAVYMKYTMFKYVLYNKISISIFC